MNAITPSTNKTAAVLFAFALIVLVFFTPECQAAELGVYSQKAMPAPGSQLITEPKHCGKCFEQVRLYNNEIMLGEPLLIEFIVNAIPNVKEPFYRNFSDDLSSDVELLIKDSSGNVWEFETEENKVFQNSATVLIVPGQPYFHQLFVSHDNQTVTGSLFDQPGQYLLLVRSKCTDPLDAKWIEHQALPLNVKAPAMNSQNAEALRMMMQNPQAYLSFQSGVAFNPQFEAPLLQIAENLPQSALHPHALYALALWQYREFNKTGNLETLKLSHQYAKTLYENYKDHPLTLKAGNLFILTATLTKNDAEAESAFNFLWQNPTLSNYMGKKPFGGMDKSGKPVPFVLQEWMIFQRSEDGIFTESEIAPAYRPQSASVQPVALSVLIWDQI
ncbi:MAG: hypothetical protein ACFCU1_13015 [Sumerlaeia bacterium]